MPRIRKADLPDVADCIRRVADMTEADLFRAYRGRGWPQNWTQGGCWIFASALRRVLPKAKLALVWGEQFGWYRPLHVVAAWRGLYWDALGAHTEEELLDYWGRWWPDVDVQPFELAPCKEGILSNRHLSRHVADVLAKKLDALRQPLAVAA